MVEPTGYTALDLIGFTDRGDYDPSAYYVKNDLVHDGVDNIWRVLIDDTHGVTPAEGLNYTFFIRNHGTESEEIIAPVESNPAAAAHAVGTQLIYDGVLYEVTTAIAVGDSLVAYPTSGYNIKAADSITGQLKSVKSGLGTAAAKNFTTSVTSGSGDLVTSGAVHSQIQTLTQALTTETTARTNADADMVNILGAKNLFRGTFKTVVDNGVTFSVMSDGSIVASGEVTEGSAYAGCYSSKFVLPKGSYILNGGPNAITSGAYLDLYTNRQIAISRNNSDYEFTLDSDTEMNCRIIVVPLDGTVYKTYKPMIRPSNIAENTYIPPILTNEELSDEVLKKTDLTRTWVSGYTQLGAGRQWFYKKCNEIHLHFDAFKESSSYPVAEDVKVMTLPSSAIPSGMSQNIYIPCVFTYRGAGDTYKGVAGLARLASDGSVYVRVLDSSQNVNTAHVDFIYHL